MIAYICIHIHIYMCVCMYSEKVLRGEGKNYYKKE